MKKKIVNTHFILETRIIIENELNNGHTVTEISRILKRDRSNIAREINKHKTYIFPSIFNGSHPCLKYNTCEVKGYECYKTCKNIEFNLCEKLNSSPHVCNGCTSKPGCRRVKQYYRANEAEMEYNLTLKECRKKLHYTEEELNILNTDFVILVINTRSIYHSVLVMNKRGFNFKVKTIYKQIEREQLKIKSRDLPRYRKKITEKPNNSYKRGNIEGHTYEDYEKFMEENPNAVEMQMDTVEGIKENNAPVLLTLEIVEIKFIMIFKLDAQTQDEVNKKLRYLKSALGEKVTEKIFQILLTDNGKEFINIEGLEEIFVKTKIFYCHPYASYEKGPIENNHELIRRVIPKGVSLKPYNQQNIQLLCSHIDSLYRNSLNGKCPFELVYDYIPKEILDELGFKRIDDDKVLLTPALLGNKNIENIKKYLNDKEIKDRNLFL